MKIVTTPMCEEIVRLAGIKDYAVNKFPQKGDGDLAILLSESRVEMDAIQIKINTSTQIFESIKKISGLAADVGFNIVADDFDYVIYPDYLKDKVIETENTVEIPSHNSVSKNPFDKAELRYGILENLI